jgi:hypothetical protein
MGKNSPTLVRAEGGTAEQEVAISDIVVPDLWHIGMELRKTDAHDLLKALRKAKGIE